MIDPGHMMHTFWHLFQEEYGRVWSCRLEKPQRASAEVNRPSWLEGQKTRMFIQMLIANIVLWGFRWEWGVYQELELRPFRLHSGKEFGCFLPMFSKLVWSWIKWMHTPHSHTWVETLIYIQLKTNAISKTKFSKSNGLIRLVEGILPHPTL